MIDSQHQRALPWACYERRCTLNVGSLQLRADRDAEFVSGKDLTDGARFHPELPPELGASPREPVGQVLTRTTRLLRCFLFFFSKDSPIHLFPLSLMELDNSSFLPPSLLSTSVVAESFEG